MSVIRIFSHHAKIISWLYFGIFSLESGDVFADPIPEGLPEWQCTYDRIINMSAERNAGDFSNQVGYFFQRNWALPGNVNAICNCPYAVTSYHPGLYTAIASLPEADHWIKLNDNLSAKVSVRIYEGPHDEVPFYKIKGYELKCTPGVPQTYNYSVSTGEIAVRVDKEILGESHFSGEIAVIYEQLDLAEGDPDYRYPYTRITGDFTVTSTAECSFRAGDTFTVDLGSTSINQLNVGAPPGAGYTARKLDLTVDCTNIPDTALSGLEYTITAAGTPNVDGPYIATSKAGIGVAMVDDSGNPIGLGTQNATINSYHNGSASAQVQLYPVIVPGEQSKVTPGSYSATAIVTVTIP